MDNPVIDTMKDDILPASRVYAGKLTLRHHAVALNPAPNLTAEYVLNLRQRLRLSRALFSRYLRTNVRTLENWEQGRARPNAQAALLMLMVERYPDTIARLASV